jgi:hypothetical protein
MPEQVIRATCSSEKHTGYDTKYCQRDATHVIEWVFNGYSKPLCKWHASFITSRRVYEGMRLNDSWAVVKEVLK